MASLGAGQFEVADAHGAVAAADEGEKIVVHEPIAAHREEDGNAPARALWTGGAEPCLWSPARRTNPGIKPRARGPATGDPGSGTSPRADTGSESDTGLAHDVQICCKGARAPHALPTEPRNHAVSSRPHGPRSGLCNRFGQPATPSTIHSPAARGPRPSTSPNAPDPEDRVLAASAQRARSGHRPDHGAGRVRRRTRGARRRPERRSQMSNMSPAAPESPVFSLGSSP